MRNLTRSIAVVSLLVPAIAYPLGIGDIKLHSALNQSLDAEIALVLSPGEQLSNVNITLAAPDKFDELGIPWSYYLSKVRFEKITTPSGGAKIRVTSREALKEPLLEFILEVSWPKGNLYRQFTVLVDPPTTYQHPSRPVITRQYEQDDYVYKPKSKRRVSDEARVDTASKVSGEGYGPVSKNDTLWNIAERLSHNSNASIEQMLIALYQENPHAFYKANINALTAGKVLKIPSQEAIVRLSRKQALQEFKRQVNEWRHPAAIAETGVQQPKGLENQLKLIAPTQETVAGSADVAAHDKSLTPEKTVESLPTPAANDSSKVASPTSPEATSVAATGSAVDKAAQEKMLELEKQIAAMQELIKLKDQQLATLQNQPISSTTTTPAASSTTPTTQPQQPAPVTTEAPTTPASPTTSPVTTTPVTPATNNTATPTQQPEKTPPAKPVRKPIAKVTQTEQESSDWIYLALGGVGLGLLGGLGWFWLRNRQKEKDAAMPFPVSAPVKSAKLTESATSTKDEGFGLDLTDNIFSTDFAISDFDVIDMDQGEIDPISEADVYLAYGRYQQAEDLIRDAINEQPDRDECKLKLLEIFYANGNKRAFETYAKELIDSGKNDDLVFWSKVTEMGSEICSDSPIFSNNFTGLNFQKPEINKSAKPSDEDKNSDLDFDLDSFDQLFDGQNDLFDLDALVPSKSEPSTKTAEPQKNNTSLDFDLSFFDEPKLEDKPASAPISTPTSTVKDLESFEFDFNLEPAPQSKPKPAATDDFDKLDFGSFNEGFETIEFTQEVKKEQAPSLEKSNNIASSIEGFDFEEALKSDQGFEAIELSQSIQSTPKSDNTIGAFDDFDFSATVSASDKPEKSFGIADLSEMDEMETKLDLAIAYIDMGDSDAAKEIALEVLKKGTAEQQMVAQALLDGL